jgi:hypothetical protein
VACACHPSYCEKHLKKSWGHFVNILGTMGKVTWEERERPWTIHWHNHYFFATVGLQMGNHFLEWILQEPWKPPALVCGNVLGWTL